MEKVEVRRWVIERAIELTKITSGIVASGKVSVDGGNYAIADSFERYVDQVTRLLDQD